MGRIMAEPIIRWKAGKSVSPASEEERALQFMTAMTKSKGISEAAIQEMERMLEQRRKELQQEKAEPEKEKKE